MPRENISPLPGQNSCAVPENFIMSNNPMSNNPEQRHIEDIVGENN